MSISLSDRTVPTRTGRLAFDPQVCNDAYTRGRQEVKV
jgi:hypothetical protein